MKIIYGTNNLIGSKTLLNRLTQHLPSKVASYSNVTNECDWNIDSIVHYNIFIYDEKYQNSDFKRLFNQIAYIKPDLIISELNLPITYIGYLLNIPVYQISPLLIYFGLTNKSYNNDFINSVKYIYRDKIKFYIEFKSMFKNLMFNSERLFIYSYLGDIDHKFELNEKYTFIKPYYIPKKISENSYKDIVNTKDYKSILKKIKYNKDTLVVSEKEYVDVTYCNELSDVYSEGLNNVNNIYCGGETSIISDGIYNNINVVQQINKQDLESGINNIINKKFNLFNCYYPEDNIVINKKDYKLYDNTKYFHEYII